MKVLYESEYVHLTLDSARHIVRYTRTTVPFATVEAAAATFRTIVSAIAGLDRSTHGLLTDLRSAPGRNDPAFEQAIAKNRNELFEGFARRATIVKTVVGAMQVQRIGREQHSPEVRVFQDEQEAIAYLTGR